MHEIARNESALGQRHVIPHPILELRQIAALVHEFKVSPLPNGCSLISNSQEWCHIACTHQVHAEDLDAVI